MGCSISGLNALYDAATGGGDVWINERRFRVLRQIGEGGFAFVYLVREHQPASDAAPARRHAARVSGTPAPPRQLMISSQRACLVCSVCWISS
jgi:serine/threonine kinase 16